MTTVEGKILEIEDKSAGSHQKNKVTLKGIDNQIAFIEFRGPMKRVIENYQIGDRVMIVIFFDGKKSKSTGTTYNNLVAKGINKSN